MTRVALGMSGGVDSSVAAALLGQQGYEVIGFTLVLKDEALRRVSIRDVDSAHAVAEFLGIAHHVLDARGLFEARIVQPFATEYACGRTPSPCVHCNPLIKFGYLLERGRELGCSRLATGHYVRIAERNGVYRMFKAADPSKDQSYFLHRLTQTMLRQALFPLAGWYKADVKTHATRLRLPIVDQGESQDLCFVDEDGHAACVESYHPELCRTGDIVDSQGRVLGQHQGFHRYTIGQRRGLGVPFSERLYVTALDPENNRVVLGTHKEAMSNHCRLTATHWISGKPPPEDRVYTVRPRYRHTGATCRLHHDPDGATAVRFDQPQFALTPGQAGVVYESDEVLGGGWIG